MKTQASATTSTPERLLRLPDVVARIGLKKSSIYELMGRTPPAFPRPVKLSRRAVCWPSSQIDSWVQDRINADSISHE